MEELHVVDLGIEDDVTTRLRKHYPYMKTTAMHAIARHCGKIVEEGIKAQMPDMKTTLSQTSFMSLPPELRNRVYQFALRQSRVGGAGEPRSKGIFIGGRLSTGFYTRNEPWEKRARRVDRWAMQPALTRVCRVIREETLPIYYGTNRFIIYATTDDNQDGMGDSYDSNFDLSSEIALRVSYDIPFKWLQAIGPANVTLLRDIRVRCGLYLNSRHLEDTSPASRFVMYASTQSIHIPRSIVTGYAFAFPRTPTHLRRSNVARKSTPVRRWTKVVEPARKNAKLPYIKKQSFYGEWDLVSKTSDSDVEDRKDFSDVDRDD